MRRNAEPGRRDSTGNRDIFDVQVQGVLCSLSTKDQKIAVVGGLLCVQIPVETTCDKTQKRSRTTRNYRKALETTLKTKKHLETAGKY